MHGLFLKKDLFQDGDRGPISLYTLLSKKINTEPPSVLTNADGGNAHSEYLGPLAEQGVPGLVLVLLLVWWTSVLGFRLWNEIDNEDKRNLAVSVYLGLMTYFIHGVLNNYLDTDKASAPFWGFIALLVVMDLDLKASKKTSQKKLLLNSLCIP